MLMGSFCNMAARHFSSATVSLQQHVPFFARVAMCCFASNQYPASAVPACSCRVLAQLQAGTHEHMQLTRSLLGTADMVLRAHAHAIEEAAGGAGDQAGLRAHRARVQDHLLNPVLVAAGELPDLDVHVLLLPYYHYLRPSAANHLCYTCTAAALLTHEASGSQHASNKRLCPRVHAWLLAAIASTPQHEEHADCVAYALELFTGSQHVQHEEQCQSLRSLLLSGSLPFMHLTLLPFKPARSTVV